MIIDLHTHIVPDRFPPAAAGASERWPSMDHFEPGHAKVMIGGRNFRTVADVCWDAQRRAADFTAEGADAQVISPMPELLSYWFHAAAGLEMARYVNDFIARMVQAAPGRFHGLGMVPLQDPEVAARELSAVQQAGLAGIEVGSNILGHSLGEPRFLAFFQEVERLGLAVFVHALHPTFSDRFPASEQLVNAIGFPTDTGLTIASLIAGGVLDACPTLRIAFSHGGGTFPFVLPRFQHAWSGQWNEQPPAQDASPTALRQGLPSSPAEYARRLYYDTLLFDARAIRYLIDVVGSSQVTVGTDFPFIARERPVGATLASLELSPAQREAVTWQNCRRFLGLGESAAA